MGGFGGGAGTQHEGGGGGGYSGGGGGFHSHGGGGGGGSFVSDAAANPVRALMGGTMTYDGNGRVLLTLLPAIQPVMPTAPALPVVRVTPCGRMGRLGPTAAQCAAAYNTTMAAATIRAVVNGVQKFVVQQTGPHFFRVSGAEGGAAYYNEAEYAGRASLFVFFAF